MPPDHPVAVSHSPLATRGALLLWACILVGCASSGDVEQLRLEREQAKAKMSAELGRERTLLTDIERESAAQRASAEKLASAFGGSTHNRPAEDASACRSSGASATAVEFWVSPHGNDANPGTRSAPFLTLERAREAVAHVEKKHWEEGDAVVFLQDGIYRLERSLQLHSDDSGRNGHDVVYRAAPGAHPIISGSVQVKDWTLHDTDLNIHKAFVGQRRSRQLYVNGRRATRARTESYPAGFQPRMVRPLDVDQSTPYPVGGGIFYDAKTDLNSARWRDPLTWTNVRDIEAVGKDQWRMAIVPLDSIASAQGQGLGLISLQQPGWTNANITFTPIWNFWQVERFENAYEFLDEPGEWYLNTTTGWLYYKPRPDEDLATADVELPWVDVLIDGQGKPDRPLSHLRFEGVTFAYATWMGPSSNTGYVPDQSGFLLIGSDHHPNTIGHNKNVVRTPGNLSFLYASHITFRQNRFEHLGAVALDFSTGSQCNTIRDNWFQDISSAAIQLGGVSEIDHAPPPPREPHITSDNRIERNVIKETGRDFVDAAGIFVGFARNTLIEHNTISDVPWSGIAIGWGWGLLDESGFPGVPGATWHEWGHYPLTPNSGNKIRYNLFERFLGDRWDGGAIYTTGQQGSSPEDPLLIEGNVAIEKRPSAGGNTFYTDGGSRYIKLKSNVSLNNPIGHMDFGLPPRLGDPLPYTTTFPVAKINTIPYGSDSGGCVTYGEIVFEDNYWLEGAMPTQELFIGLFDLVATSVLSWFDPKLAPFDPYSSKGFFDICPYTDKATGTSYPTQLTYTNNHRIKGRGDVPRPILDQAGAQTKLLEQTIEK